MAKARIFYKIPEIPEKKVFTDNESGLSKYVLHFNFHAFGSAESVAGY
jgi:hypothetical protein